MTSETRGCLIEFEDIDYSVSTTDPKAKGGMFKKEKTTKQIIKGVTGRVEAGQTLAIMGASGAGKTTLLNILAGRITGEGLKGDIKFDGKKLSPKEISGIVGFVMQNDIFIEFLTVYETLTFAARMKIKGDKTERDRRIDGLIHELRLEATRNTLVGGQFKKGISGGEKKRLNIAFELISDPPVIFLDEPTSGLDSYTSYLVVKLMGKIAKEVKKTVIYTIHQPSSEIFRMFDQLLLIYRGKLIYQGNSSESVGYFANQLNLPCKNDSNPSDHFMYIMQVFHPKVEHELISKYDQLIAPKYSKMFKDQEHPDEPTFTLKNFSPVWVQFSALFWRGALISKRNPLLTFVKVMQVLVMAFFFCSVYFRLDNDPNSSDQTPVFNKNGSLFFMTVFNFIPSMMGLLVAFPMQRAVFLKEYSGRFYSTLPYYMSKVIVELPLTIFFPVLWTCIIYYIVNYNTPFLALVKMCIVAALTAYASMCLGLMIGAGFTSIDSALNIAPLIFFPLMLFSGFYVNSDSIPAWTSWIEYISPFRYALEALTYNEYGGRGFYPNPIETFGFDLGYTISALLLLAIGVVLMIMGYFMLLFRARTINN